MKMPVAMRDKWVAALRSGKYKQGQGSLRTSEGAHCCIGVLQEEVSGDVERLGEGSAPVASIFSNKWCEENGVLIDVPYSKQKYHSSVMSDKQVATLVEMNDGPNYCENNDEEDAAYNVQYIQSFSVIADWIEKNVETY